jgi:preprotein translocase subunit SecB
LDARGEGGVKPSPIQLLQLFFKHVRVEVDPDHIPAEPANPLNSAFVFDGISIQTEFGIGEIDPDHERGRMFLTTLRVIVDNKPLPKEDGQKFSPYKIDVAVDGVVAIPNGAEKLAPPESLAAVNGASLLWSAVREQVLSLTARMAAGSVMLPTVHFHDLKKEAAATPGEATGSNEEQTSAVKPKRPSVKRIR